mmetsp:Transcript_23148/g.66439  ORF Transcript_23148/g.66439 Transcript_23148/m.66439 type:complete len:251 (-) Transcript_23148:324-1076(-)
MLATASPSLTVKNGFLEFQFGDLVESSPLASRPRSLPPKFRCAEGGADDGDDDVAQDAGEEQLRCLAEIMSPKPRPRLANLASPSPTASLVGSPASFGEGSSSSSSSKMDGYMAMPPSVHREAIDAEDLASYSVGSQGHTQRRCKPCAFARAPPGCKFGAACCFCHVVAEHPEPVRVRPCKGKRERVKRQLAALEQAISKDPELLAAGNLVLPALVERGEAARARVMAHLSQVAADAYRAQICMGDKSRC